MQYPRFRQQGWPIGSGMVESANKNVVEARLKGAGMHWERKNVNPMLALRNAVCNARWQEMWRKAVLYHQKQQALHRKDRVEQRAQAFLAVCNPSQVPSPSQLVSETEVPCVAHQSPVPTVPLSGFSRSSAHRPKLRATHHSPSKSEQHVSHQTKGEAGIEACICGTSIMQSKGGGRTRHYCSDRCRVRAYRKREKKWISSVRRRVQSSREQTG